MIESIVADGVTLAYLLLGEPPPDQTTFLTPPEAPLQVGFVVYESGGVVQRHRHLPVERHLKESAEVLVVQEGRCLLDVYDDHQQVVATRELGAGDVVIALAGGHGFRMLEHTVLLEVKQGPYPGVTEKERF